MLTLLAEIAVNEGTWWSLVRTFGVPGAMLAVVIFAMYRGWLVTGREVDEIKGQGAKTEEMLVGRINDLVKEKDEWKAMSLRGVGLVEKAAETAKRLAEKEGH